MEGGPYVVRVPRVEVLSPRSAGLTGEGSGHRWSTPMGQERRQPREASSGRESPCTLHYSLCGRGRKGRPSFSVLCSLQLQDLKLK